MSQELLELKNFGYELPPHLIAQIPLSNRSGSRLLLRHADGPMEHRQFSELPQLLAPGTLLLYNDSKVLPGRIIGSSPQGGRLELMLLKPVAGSKNRWETLGRPLRKLHEGFQLNLPGGCIATIIRRIESDIQPYVEVEFNLPHADFFDWLDREGYIPLPPYIARANAQTASQSLDRDRYQTMYAKERGSVAAPTAGLHFNSDIWLQLKAVGIQTAPVTLHVGGGTFLPVKTNVLEAHPMHSESFRIPLTSYQAIIKAKAEGRQVLAIGTTSLRCLESFALACKQTTNPEKLTDQWLETQLFIYPKLASDRYQPWAIDGLMTNFHQPESSLLMLVSALIGFEETKILYQAALAAEYRFLSYGDTSLLWL